MSRRLLNLINNNQPQLPANKKFLADVMSCIERMGQEGRRKGHAAPIFFSNWFSGKDLVLQ